MSDTAAGTTPSPAFQLLALEQSEFERFLHDDLGQCLVAIRSMAAALERDEDGEVAQMISAAAGDAYVEAYDLMMELRAESLAEAPDLISALRQCIDDARLETRELVAKLNPGAQIENACDALCRRLLLRSLRCIIAVIKRLGENGGELIIDIDRESDHLHLAVQWMPGGFPEPFFEHARVQRLHARLQAFGGQAMRQESRGYPAFSVRLPCQCGEPG